MSARSANRRLVVKLIVVAIGMFGFGFALAPMYTKLCELTGLNNLQTSDAASLNTQVDRSRTITVQFDANLRNELPWSFRPLTKSMQVHPGQLVNVVYEVKNASDSDLFGQAIPSYGPQVAGRYFKKLECFCFTRQELKPNETRQMPVVFVVEAGLPADVHTITLSYTFFRVEGAGPKPG
jgi:cytochrome c oxidase assembly protein subunit 11